jgi:hypothetical protein
MYHHAWLSSLDILIDQNQMFLGFFFFFVVLGFELRGYTTGPFFGDGFFKIGSCKLFAQADFKPLSS